MSTFQKIGFSIAVAVMLFLSGKGLASYFGQSSSMTFTSADTVSSVQTATPTIQTSPSMMGSQSNTAPMMGTRRTRTS